MLLKRKIAIRAIVTEDFKQRLIARLEGALEELAKAQQDLDVQGKRYLSELQQKEPAKANEFARRLERQRHKNEEIRVRLTQELSQARSLSIGAECLYGKVEGLVEISVGDNLTEKMRSAEIVIKDDVIIEMRNC